MPIQYLDQEVPPGFKLRHKLRGHDTWINRIAWSPDGRTLASSSYINDRIAPNIGAGIWLWNTESGGLRRTLGEHSDIVYCVAFSPDGQTLASASADNTIRTWDPENGKMHWVFEGHTGKVYCVAWSPDCQTLASASSDTTIRLWNTYPGFLRNVLEGHTDIVYCVAWSPDGQTLASASADNTIRTWDPANGKTLRIFKGHTGKVLTLTWSNDGQRLVSGGADRTIRIWNLDTGYQMSVLEGHTDSVTSLDFSPDGFFLASKSRDWTVRLWHSNTWRVVAILSEPASSMSFPGLAFHPHEPAVLATLGDLDATIRIWELDVVGLLGTVPAIKSFQYITAKVALVGDSGVGKTGLGWRLAQGEFKEHPSTHGEQFWIMDNLHQVRSDGTECEVVLWDFAGQPDYRLIHALFLDDADVAMILFDPCNRQEPLKGVEYWLKALSHRKSQPSGTILVGAC